MRKWRRGIFFGLALGCIASVFAFTPWYQKLENSLGLYALFHLRGAIAAPPELVVVGINNRTGAKLQLAQLPRDWPRSMHAQLIEKLQGAAVIIFDMDFRQAKDPASDAAFAAAIARAGNVVLFEHLDGRLQPVEDSEGRHQGAIWIENREPPLPIFAQAAQGLGPFPLPKLDAGVDRFWTFKSSASDVPTMPVVALQIYAQKILGDKLAGSGIFLARTFTADSTTNTSATATALQLKDWMLAQRAHFENQSANPAIQREQLTSEQLTDEQARLLHSLVQLYRGANVRFLNFYGGPGSILNLPYQSVIQGEDPNLAPGALDVRGKIVFVGYSDLFDPGQPDRFYTIFTQDNGVDLSGVEIAATALGNLLRDESLKPLGAVHTLLLLLAFGLVLGAISYLMPANFGVPASLLLAGIYLALAQWNFNQHHFWWPLATPLLVIVPLALTLGLFGQYRLERKRARTFSDAIRLYLPEEVSRQMAVDSERAANVINKVTYSSCLATDMAGFSTLAETMNPGQLAQFLNDYFEALAQPLKEQGVNITEFRADAIMCAWTGPRDDPRVRRLPIIAALAACKAIAKFNLTRDLSGQLRVGIAEGDVYVGHAGGGGHFVYSIVGDCANTASRIEGLNKQLHTQVLATSSVLQGIEDFLTRRVGNFYFVGKSEALAICEIAAPFNLASDTQKQIFYDYQIALDYFEAGDWNRAQAQLEAILMAHPQDGPSQFLHRRCREYLASDNLPSNPQIITLTSK